jgi:hypothetical protein
MTEYVATVSIAFYTSVGEKCSEDYVRGYIRSLMDALEKDVGDIIDIEEISVKKV